MKLPDPLHPALVHFPIVLILVGAALAVAACIWWRTWLVRSVAAVMAVAALGTLAAAWSGEEDEEAAEHAGAVVEQVFEEHEEWGERARNAALLAACLAVGAAALYGRMPKAARGAAVLAAVTALSASWCVVEAGHYGGRLVYQHGVGVKPSSTAGISAKPRKHHDDD